MLSYFTVLSNWLSGFERYSRTYSKANLPKSTYPDEFYLLTPGEHQIGIAKASSLLERTQISGDTLIRVDSTLDMNDVTPNRRNGKGWVYPSSVIPVEKVAILKDGQFEETSVEEVTAAAFLLDDAKMQSWQNLQPLTLSFLPVAMACQASCLFCFSSSSISLERKKRISDFGDLDYWCRRAKKQGAKRFVITGGGEPTIMPFEELIEAYKISSQVFDKNVLITNGMFLSKLNEEDISAKLIELKQSGLSVLSLSFHHYDVSTRAAIMGVDTKAEKVLEVAARMDKDLIPKLRIICVLQKGGVEKEEDLEKFVALAERYNVEQLCFKELYVAAATESLYSKSKENLYSATHQVPLSVVTDYAGKHALEVVAELPWGAPIYRHRSADGRVVDIAAYTEPSVGWERSNGIARSWNYMADKKCFASLEDPASELTIPEVQA